MDNDKEIVQIVGSSEGIEKFMQSIKFCPYHDYEEGTCSELGHCDKCPFKNVEFVYTNM